METPEGRGKPAGQRQRLNQSEGPEPVCGGGVRAPARGVETSVARKLAGVFRAVAGRRTQRREAWRHPRGGLSKKEAALVARHRASSRGFATARYARLCVAAKRSQPPPSVTHVVRRCRSVAPPTLRQVQERQARTRSGGILSSLLFVSRFSCAKRKSAFHLERCRDGRYEWRAIAGKNPRFHHARSSSDH